MQLSFIFKKKKHIINITLQLKTLHQKPLRQTPNLFNIHVS